MPRSSARARARWRLRAPRPRPDADPARCRSVRHCAWRSVPAPVREAPSRGRPRPGRASPPAARCAAASAIPLAALTSRNCRRVQCVHMSRSSVSSLPSCEMSDRGFILPANEGLPIVAPRSCMLSECSARSKRCPRRGVGMSVSRNSPRMGTRCETMHRSLPGQPASTVVAGVEPG